jgi:hypothetical protein
MGNLDKMKEVIFKFLDSPAFKEEGVDTENFRKWLAVCDLPSCPYDAIKELIACLESAEEKQKLGFVDLIRLLLL